MTKYVAYTNLGPGRESGTILNPDDFGGESSDGFQDMLRARTVVPLGDPDAAIAMGQNPDALATDDEKDKELEAARKKVKELEAALEQARKSQTQTSSGSGTSGGSSQQVNPSGTSSSGPSQPSGSATKSVTPGTTK